jgi:hypothetical protein
MVVSNINMNNETDTTRYVNGYIIIVLVSILISSWTAVLFNCK